MKLTLKQFYKIKPQLDGWVFWRREKDMIIVIQVQPYSKISNLLKSTQ